MKKINLNKFNRLVESRLGNIKPILKEEWPPFQITPEELEMYKDLGSKAEKSYNECKRTIENSNLQMLNFDVFADECFSCMELYFEMYRGEEMSNLVELQSDCLDQIMDFLGETEDDITDTQSLFTCMNNEIIS